LQELVIHHGYGKEADLTAASKGLPVAKSSPARLVVLLAFVRRGATIGEMISSSQQLSTRRGA
jgi:hypothetical protein